MQVNKNCIVTSPFCVHTHLPTLRVKRGDNNIWYEPISIIVLIKPKLLLRTKTKLFDCVDPSGILVAILVRVIVIK